MKKATKLRAGENVFGWLMLLLSLFVLVQAFRISGFSSISSPGTFPMIAAAIMAASAVTILLRNRRLERPDAENLRDELRQAGHFVLSKVFLAYTGIIILYMLVFEPLRFLPSSAAFLFVSIYYLKGGGFVKSALIAGGSLAVIYLVFHTLFRVVLP